MYQVACAELAPVRDQIEPQDETSAMFTQTAAVKTGRRINPSRERPAIMRMMIPLAFGLALIPAWAAPAAEPPTSQSGWSFSLGGGFGIGPKFEGASRTEATPLPVASAQWQSGSTWGTTFFAGTDRGLGVSFGDEESFVFGVAMSYGGGRKEKDDPRLRGLGNIDASVLGGVFLDVPLGPISFRIDTQSDLSGETGTTVNFGLGAGLPITERLSLGASAFATWADADHMAAYFSVTRRQAQRSQARLRRFDADAGFKSVTFGLDATYAFTPNLHLGLSAGVVNLIGDAAQSPISSRDVQPTFSVSLVFSF